MLPLFMGLACDYYGNWQQQQNSMATFLIGFDIRFASQL